MTSKQLSEADPIDVTRCEAKSDRVLAKLHMDERLLAAASKSVTGDRVWFALRAVHRSELDLCRTLDDSDVDAVVPVREVQGGRRLGSRASRVVHKPVLAGLVFVNIVPSSEAFQGLLRVRTAQAFIGTGEGPHPIGNREMNSFMDLAQKGAFDERNTPAGLKVGSRVRIPVGPFADFHGVLEGYAPGRPARVRTMLFGQELLVDVMLAHLEKLE
ncbi:transcription termination/antitermination NusG family protein [Mesorhizobium sp. CAU 1741]